MRNQKAFYYNQNYCVGCHACQTSCMVFHKLDVGMNWRKVQDFEVEVNGHEVERHLSTACNHCETPACVAACPQHAYTKREKDGLVVQDHSKCIGCGKCIDACPYKAPQMNPTTGKVEKCDGCYSLVDQGKVPDCVRGCPVQALQFDDLAKLDAKGALKTAIGFKVFNTHPSTRFVPPRKA